VKLQSRFVASISVGIVAVLLVSEFVRQAFESAQLVNLEKSSPERMEAAMRANLAPIAQAVQGALEDAMAEGNMDLLSKILSRQSKVDGVLETTIYGVGGKASYSSSQSGVGKSLDEDLLARVIETGKPTNRRAGPVFEVYQPFVVTESCTSCHGDWKVGKVGGVLGIHISNQSFVRAQSDWISAVQGLRHDNLVVGALISLALVATLVIVVRTLVGRLMIRPLAAATRFVERISRGDLTEEIDPALCGRHDEFGFLATAMAAMAGHLRQLLGKILSTVQTIHDASTGLSATATQTAAGVERMGTKSSAATEAAQGSQTHVQSLAVAMKDAAQNLCSATKATDDMGASIVSTLQQSEQAKQTANQATAKASSISASIASLNEAAKAIGQVTETITGISAQTNLLALNATIEAARAGALGRGFGVVATEIKDLAEQTARATQDVKDRIASVQTSTATALVDLRSITSVIQEVGDTVSVTVAAMSEHAEISKGVVRQLEETSARVTQASQDVTSSVEASGTIATEIGEVNVAARELRRGGEQVQERAQELLALARGLTGVFEQFKLPSQSR
jgi:methyl-accepting chemotaxis protein